MHQKEQVFATDYNSLTTELAILNELEKIKQKLKDNKWWIEE